MSPEAAKTSNKPESLEHGALALAGAIALSGPGTLAELRRTRPGHGCGAFWRLYHRCCAPTREGSSEDWEWLAHALAILTHTGPPDSDRSPYDPTRSLGKELAAADVSEMRVARLLVATREARRPTLIRILRRLAQDNVKLDVCELARLLIRNRAQAALRRVADDYYGARDSAKRADKKEAENA